MFIKHTVQTKILNYLKLRKIDINHEKNITNLVEWFYKKNL